MNHDPDSASERVAQDTGPSMTAVDPEFGLLADMTDDDGTESGDAGGAEADTDVAASDRAETDAAQEDDDAVVARIADLLEVGRGDRFIRRLVDPASAIGGLGPRLRRLCHDLDNEGDEATAFERFGDALDEARIAAADLTLAVPVLAGLTARTVVRDLAHGGVTVDADGRLHLVRQALTAAHAMVADRHAGALVPLARHLVRHALRRGAQPRAVADALPRTAARLAAEPDLIQRLAQRSMPSDQTGHRSDQMGRGPWGRPRHFVLNSPVEITILAR